MVIHFQFCNHFLSIDWDVSSGEVKARIQGLGTGSHGPWSSLVNLRTHYYMPLAWHSMAGTNWHATTYVGRHGLPCLTAKSLGQRS